MAKEKGWFTEYRPLKSKVYHQDWNDVTCEVLGIGTVELRVRSDPDDWTKTEVLQLEEVLHVPGVPVNIICHQKLGKTTRIDFHNPNRGTLGGVKNDNGKQLAYFRYLDYSNRTSPVSQQGHLVPGTKEAPDGVVVPSCAPEGYTLGESTFQNTFLPLPGALQVRWVTWREEDQKPATSG